MDCRHSTLSIGKDPQCHVPMFMGHKQAKIDSVAVIAPVNMEIPGCTIQLIQGELKEEYSSFCEALVEPMSCVPPMNLCIARTLSPVMLGKEVVLQVMNVSPTPITIYKGMKLGEATPRHNVMLVDDNINNVTATQKDRSQAPDFNFDHPDLTPSENTQLQNLLTQFADLFSPKGGPVGQTPPVKQPSRRIPEVLKGVVDAEVSRMLEQGVVKPSSSPWSSLPIVMVRKKDGSWRFCVDY